jgi:hypothetical protein
LQRHDLQVFGRTRDDAKWDEASRLAAIMLMRIDAKLALILDELEIDDGEETDYSCGARGVGPGPQGLADWLERHAERKRARVQRAELRRARVHRLTFGLLGR